MWDFISGFGDNSVSSTKAKVIGFMDLNQLRGQTISRSIDIIFRKKWNRKKNTAGQRLEEGY